MLGGRKSTSALELKRLMGGKDAIIILIFLLVMNALMFYAFVHFDFYYSYMVLNKSRLEANLNEVGGEITNDHAGAASCLQEKRRRQFQAGEKIFIDSNGEEHGLFLETQVLNNLIQEMKYTYYYPELIERELGKIQNLPYASQYQSIYARRQIPRFENVNACKAFFPYQFSSLAVMIHLFYILFYHRKKECQTGADILFYHGGFSGRHWHSIWRILFWMTLADLFLFRLEDFLLARYYLGAPAITLKLPLYAIHDFAFSPWSGSILSAMLFDFFCKWSFLSCLFFCASLVTQKSHRPILCFIGTTVLLFLLIVMRDERIWPGNPLHLLRVMPLIQEPKWLYMAGKPILFQNVIFLWSGFLLLPGFVWALFPFFRPRSAIRRKATC